MSAAVIDSKHQDSLDESVAALHNEFNQVMKQNEETNKRLQDAKLAREARRNQLLTSSKSDKASDKKARDEAKKQREEAKKAREEAKKQREEAKKARDELKDKKSQQQTVTPPKIVASKHTPTSQEVEIAKLIAADIANKPLLDIVFANRGAVYGGYLRDKFAGDVPNDIDVVIPENNYISFMEQVLKLGYANKMEDQLVTLTPNASLPAGTLPVEMFTTDLDPETTNLGAECDPDYTVNLLGYDGTNLYSWAGDDDDIDLIVHSIKTRETFAINPAENRIKKMATKKYKVMIPTAVYNPIKFNSKEDDDEYWG